MKSAIMLGLMSGTSLDGLDLCLTEFSIVEGGYQFKILKAVSVEYSEEWQDKLRQAYTFSAQELHQLDVDLAKYFALEVNRFLISQNVKPDFLASHGHTIFHQPDKGFTTQIGNGNTLFCETNIPVVYNFRSLDVSLGGQGAPLVPVGDMHLFAEYKACINFGGIANISFEKNGQRLANDICPVNMALSDLTLELNLPYDDGGTIASSGKVDHVLLRELNKLNFYHQIGPKSLGIEWYNAHFRKLIKNNLITIEDRLRTVVEHIANQIKTILDDIDDGDILVTGGGVYNTYLMTILQSKVKQQVVIPSTELIEFKEAMVFAFLGWLRVNDKINVLKTVTGSRIDSSSGVIIK